MILSAPCSPLIPPSFRNPVAATPLPAADASAGQVLAALDGQTARLDMANGRMSDVIAIVVACDRRAREAAASAKF